MQHYDLFVIGGGINGAGIARDAAGRGLAVGLAEQGDFGGATSSSSSKLIHGGLRYLEHYEFRLVAESLAEREVLLRTASHLIRPLQFILPQQQDLRPAWMMRAGLWLYDRLGGRSSLPRSHSVDLRPGGYGAGLDDCFKQGYAYWDAWVDDARLVIANLRSASSYGAQVMTHTQFISARARDGKWTLRLRLPNGDESACTARVLVNAAGPWVAQVLEGIVGDPSAPVRLLKGSHIVVPRVHAGSHAYILQNADRRVFFILPFERDFSLIGTTEVAVRSPQQDIEAEEIRYLIDAANRYLLRPVQESDIQWTYSGVRSLYDDGKKNATAVTRDYRLKLQMQEAAPLLNVYGGKVTTYRKLAEAALKKLAPWLQTGRGSWTQNEALPGSQFKPEERDGLLASLSAQYAQLPPSLLRALFARHGSEVVQVLQGIRATADLGQYFGANLYEHEARYFVEQEWAVAAEDILWRRSKEGLHMTAAERETFTTWLLREHPR